MRKAENLTEFEQLVYNYIKDAIENGKYEVHLNDDFSSVVGGYVDGYVTIGGTNIECAFHSSNYICWLKGGFIEPILRLMTREEETKICYEAYSLAKINQSGIEKLIADYEKRIESLKSCINTNGRIKQLKK